MARPSSRGRRTNRYYGVGLEHLAFEVDTTAEVDAAHERCSRRGDRIHHPPEEDSEIPDLELGREMNSGAPSIRVV